MAGCLFMRHEAKLPFKRPERVLLLVARPGPADRQTSFLEVPFLFESPTVSDSFASGTEAAKQLERPRGIDETAESCSLFETRGGDHQSIGLLRLRIGRLVVRWDSASDSAASNRSRSST
jgi:hypothetical protein